MMESLLSNWHWIQSHFWLAQLPEIYDRSWQVASCWKDMFYGKEEVVRGAELGVGGGGNARCFSHTQRAGNFGMSSCNYLSTQSESGSLPTLSWSSGQENYDTFCKSSNKVILRWLPRDWGGGLQSWEMGWNTIIFKAVYIKIWRIFSVFHTHFGGICYQIQIVDLRNLV